MTRVLNRAAALRGAGITATSGNLKAGFEVIHKRLNAEVKKIKDRTNKGLLLAAINIRRDMQVTTPTIPVDLANLKASWFITTKPTAVVTVRSLEVRGGKFVAGTKPKILTRLKSEHPQALAEVKGELGKFPIGVGMGFTAFYAAAVHEMGVSGPSAGKPIKWSLPGSGAKFFQAALYRNFDDIIKTVQINAMVRP